MVNAELSNSAWCRRGGRSFDQGCRQKIDENLGSERNMPARDMERIDAGTGQRKIKAHRWRRVSMIAKQYSIALPADYDMGIIRRRVAERGARFDSFPGLYLKAFLIRERGRAGAVGNEYAPFYLWPETEALWDFVAGDGFRAIVDGFG